LAPPARCLTSAYEQERLLVSLKNFRFALEKELIIFDLVPYYPPTHNNKSRWPYRLPFSIWAALGLPLKTISDFPRFAWQLA